MPKLKNALQAHQTQAAIQAAKRKAEENRQQQQQAKSRPGDAGPSSKKRKHASTSDPRSKLAAGPRSTLPSLAKSAKTTTAPPPVAARKAPKPTIPFDHLDTILLLGEANFSFTRSLLRAPHNLSGHMICATSYDPREVCLKKYPDAAEILAEIEGKGVRVVFGVDAGDLPSSVTGKGKGKERQRWSKVVFNFPHAGEFAQPRAPRHNEISIAALRTNA
jgi:25S rRNA (uracil2634-N3)-methyltransferase